MDCVFCHHGQPLSLERVKKLFRRLANQVASMPTVNAAIEFATDNANIYLSVDCGDDVPFVDLHTDNGGRVHLSVLKPPHGLPYRIHVGNEADGDFVPGDIATIRAELAYVIREWRLGLQDATCESNEEDGKLFGLELIGSRLAVRRGDQEVQLEPRHFKLLAYFLENGNAPSDTEALKQGPWSHDTRTTGKTIGDGCKFLSKQLEAIGLMVSSTKGKWQLALRPQAQKSGPKA